MRLFILGLPGSGKGTICEELTKQFAQIPYYNVGEILRKQSDNDNHIKQVHAEGGLVNSNRVLSIFEEVLSNTKFICDGSPRKQAEADWILNHSSWKQRPGVLVYLTVPESTARERLQMRKRFDDHPEIIENRFAAFHNETLKSIMAFEEARQLIRIDATKNPQEICKEIIWAHHNHIVQLYR